MAKAALLDTTPAYRWTRRYAECKATGCAALATKAVVLVVPKVKGSTEAVTLINVRVCDAHAVEFKDIVAEVKAAGIIAAVNRFVDARGLEPIEYERARWRLVSLTGE